MLDCVPYVCVDEFMMFTFYVSCLIYRVLALLMVQLFDYPLKIYKAYSDLVLQLNNCGILKFTVNRKKKAHDAFSCVIVL